MSKRPEPRPAVGLDRRPSVLAGQSPVAPHTENSGNTGNTTVDGKRGNAGVGAVAANAAYTKLSVRLSEELAGRARAAFWSTAHLTGVKSLSDWVAGAIEAQLERDEALYNGGSRFEPLEPGSIPTGRRS